MRVVTDMILRDIAGECVLIPTGETARRLNGIVSLTDSGKLLWQLLQQDRTEEELTAALLAEYEVDPETAAADVAAFLEKLRREGFLVQ